MLGEEVGWRVNEGSILVGVEYLVCVSLRDHRRFGVCSLSCEADRRAWVNRECPIVAGTVSISFISCYRAGAESQASFW